MKHPLAQFLYCPECGSPHFEVNNEKSKKCTDCGFVYYFNPSSATVALILNEKKEVIGSTGVLRQGEYLPSITLTEPLTERETSVTVRIVAYEPDTWQSRGNVNLNLTLYLNYS